ncbi:MAG: phosphotransferase, partial [Nocardioidaceae bacterium]
MLYAVRLGDLAQPPQILAKVRRDEQAPNARQSPPRTERPRLRTDTVTAGELTMWEYAGLRSIFQRFADAGPAFGAVRPLAHLAAQNTILMDFVDATTMRQLFVTESRVRRPLHASQVKAEVWRRAGGWLHAFQQVATERELPARQACRGEVVRLFEAYGGFLRDRLGQRAIGSIAEDGARLASTVLPDQLPLATSHGDYAARNMFVGRAGRLTVFD